MRLRFSKGSIVVGALAVVSIAAEVAFLLRDPLPHFFARRSTLKEATAAPPTMDRGYELQQVRLTGASGLSVELTVRRTPADTRRLPLVLILGGHYKGRDAVKLLGDTRGTLVAVMSYPFAGDPRPDAWTFLREIPAIRTAFLDTPPALMLSLDYLLGRADVERTSVEAVGVSLGAPFVCIEPWCGTASPADFDGEFTDKPGLMHIAPGGKRVLKYRIRAS